MDLRQKLSKKLSKREMKFLKTSFDIIGDIAVIEIPDELMKKQKLIAETLMNIHNYNLFHYF
jgi:tRNA (guanine37-N1)-methyltransferase